MGKSESPLCEPIRENLLASSTVNSRLSKTNKQIQHCRYCGGKHDARREACPASMAICYDCNKLGHFKKYCRSRVSSQRSVLNDSRPSVSFIAGVPSSLQHTTIPIIVKDRSFQALIDSGAGQSFMKSSVVSTLGFLPTGPNYAIKLASEKCSAKVLGSVEVQFHAASGDYTLRFGVVDELCTDFILGVDFMRLHSQVTFKFNGSVDPLTVCCNLLVSKVSPLRVFQFLKPDCKPIAAPSRRYSRRDADFIRDEVQRLLEEGIVEPSHSPWRAQPLVTKDLRHKRRLVIDYSQTVNKYTNLDAYPLPRIEDIINEVAKGKYFSTVDLKSAYHQVPLHADDRPFTAFAAGGSLYQFCRLPFGITNGVAAFQRFIDDFISKYHLRGTVAYLDDVTIYGETKQEHDERLQAFLDAAREHNLTINTDKSTFGMMDIKLLGHHISCGNIKPDPENLKPLINMAPPSDSKALKRCLGMFSYYSKWIPNFSAKIRPLVKTSKFPIDSDAAEAFELLKIDLSRSCLGCVYEDKPFTLECDASDHTIAAILNQDGRPVSFFSRTLSKSEINYPPIEKEALAIIESVRKYSYLLANTSFNLVTDQKALSFIFKKNHNSKVKNSKLCLWRLELSSFN